MGTVLLVICSFQQRVFSDLSLWMVISFLADDMIFILLVGEMFSNFKFYFHVITKFKITNIKFFFSNHKGRNHNYGWAWLNSETEFQSLTQQAKF